MKLQANFADSSLLIENAYTARLAISRGGILSLNYLELPECGILMRLFSSIHPELLDLNFELYDKLKMASNELKIGVFYLRYTLNYSTLQVLDILSSIQVEQRSPEEWVRDIYEDKYPIEFEGFVNWSGLAESLMNFQKVTFFLYRGLPYMLSWDSTNSNVLRCQNY